MSNHIFESIVISYFFFCLSIAILGMIQAAKFQRNATQLMNKMAALNEEYRVKFTDFLTPEGNPNWFPMASIGMKKYDQILFTKDFDEITEIHELRERCLRHRKRHFQFIAFFFIQLFFVVLLPYIANSILDILQ